MNLIRKLIEEKFDGNYPYWYSQSLGGIKGMGLCDRTNEYFTDSRIVYFKPKTSIKNEWYCYGCNVVFNDCSCKKSL